MEKQMYGIGETFGIKADTAATVPGFKVDPASPTAQFVPAVDSNYKFTTESLRDILAWVKLSDIGLLENEGFLSFGPKGAGKTSLILQVAARLGVPVIEVTGHGRLEVEDLLGRNTVVGGDILFQDGPFTTAARLGCWVLINEIDAIDPSQQVGLNSLAERRPFLIPQTGETVVPHPDFRVLATANTNLAGDSNGAFAGTQRQNSAFADRFMFSECGYPSPDAELEIIQGLVPGLPPELAKVLINVANVVRKHYVEGELDITLSTRSLVRWGKLTWAFSKAAGISSPVVYAMHRAFGFQSDADSRVILEEILQRVLQEGGA